MRERRRSRRVVLTMEVKPYLNVYSTMFEHKHSRIVVDEGIRERRRWEGGNGGKATGGKTTGAKAPRTQDSQETGWKGDMLMGEREMNNRLPSDRTAGQNATEGIRRKSYSEVVIEGVNRRARVFVGRIR